MKSFKSTQLHNHTLKKEEASSLEHISKRCKLFKTLFTLFISSFLVMSVFATPEGNTREGDYLPIILLFFLMGISLTLLFYKLFKTKDKSTYTIKNFQNLFIPLADYSLLFFALFVTASYLRIVFLKQGDVRFSTNAYWTAITPVLFYYLIRFYRQIITKQIVLGLLGLLFVCGIVESAYSIYSYTVIDPQLRKSYLQNPEQTLRAANLNFAADSRELELFEKRLLESSEPSGSYGLANTLAGFLVPIIILILFLILFKFNSTLPNHNFSNHTKIGLLFNKSFILLCAGGITVLVALILTKSRSGFISATVGCLFAILIIGQTFYFQKKSNGTKRVMRSIKVFFVFITMLLGGAYFTGQIDSEVFTEAGKSLGYRIDYWKASCLMIHDHILFGVGPGEFQNIYAQYILPTASEFIADPHNFIFEIAALFGIPALLSFLVFITAILGIVIKSLLHHETTTLLTTPTDNENILIIHENKPGLYLGGIYLGLTLLILCLPFQDTPISLRFLLTSLPVVLLAVPICSEMNKLLDLSSTKPFIAIIGVMFFALLLNLCVAGGFEYPVISVVLFFLAAILVNQTFAPNSPVTSYCIPTSNNLICILILGTLVLCGFYLTAFKPRSNSFMFSLQYDPQQISKSQYLDLLIKGNFNKIDGASSKVAEQFYFFSGLEYAHAQTDANRERWKKTQQHVKHVSPNSATIHERCGDFDFELYNRQKNAKNTNRDFLVSSQDFYQKSVELSPTNANVRVKLYRVFVLLNNKDEAISEAQKALELDRITHHDDRKLLERDRVELTRFLENIQNEVR